MAMYPHGRNKLFTQFADGLSYSRNRMEEALTSGILDKGAAQPTKEVFKCKKEDVDIIVRWLAFRHLIVYGV